MRLKLVAISAALSLTVLADASAAAPLETINLDAAAVVRHDSAHGISLRPLGDIPYTITCMISNYSGNSHLPIEFYPLHGKVGHIMIGDRSGGADKVHFPVNISQGTFKLTMTNVVRSRNDGIVLKNNSQVKESDIVVSACYATS